MYIRAGMIAIIIPMLALWAPFTPLVAAGPAPTPVPSPATQFVQPSYAFVTSDGCPRPIRSDMGGGGGEEPFVAGASSDDSALVTQIVDVPGRVDRVAFDHSGRQVIAGGESEVGSVTLGIWDATTGHLRRTLDAVDGQQLGPMLTPDSGKLVIGGVVAPDATSFVAFWDAKTGALQQAWSFEHAIHAMALSPDSQSLALGTWDNSQGLAVIQIVSMHTGQVTRKLMGTHVTLDADTTGRGTANPAIHVAYGHADHIVDLAFSPDGRQLVSTGSDGSARVWDVATGQHLRCVGLGGRPVHQYDPHGGFIAGQLDSDRSTLVAVTGEDKDGTIDVIKWNTRTGATRDLEIPLALGDPGSTFLFGGAATLSPDTQWVALAAQDQASVRLYDTTTGRLAGIVRLPDAAVAIDFSLDGTDLVAALRPAEDPQADESTVLSSILVLDLAHDSVDAAAAAERMLLAGITQALQGNLAKARTQWQRAATLDPHAGYDVSTDAMHRLQNYVQQRTDDMLISHDIDNVLALVRLVAPTGIGYQDAYTALCWFGSSADRAAVVLPYCDKSVQGQSYDADPFDSRGIARALTGDLAGALADFEQAATLTPAQDTLAQVRPAWIETLQQGKNPITPAVRSTLVCLTPADLRANLGPAVLATIATQCAALEH